MTVFEIKEKITNAIFEATKEYGIAVDQILLEHPEVESFGDYSCNIAMRLSKTLKKNPLEIAKEIVEKVSVNQYIGKSVDQYDGSDKENVIEKVEVKAPGFINFWIKKEALLETIKAPYEFPKTGKKVMVEYSSPNPNKPMHLGHARNNALGMAVGNLLKYVGDDVIFINWINNISSAICKSLWGYLKYGSKIEGSVNKNWKDLLDKWYENQNEWKKPNKKPDFFVMDFYVAAEKADKENPDVKKEFIDMLMLWESGDKKVRKLWETVIGWNYEGWNETYDKQKCHFDRWYYESDLYEEGKDVIEANFKKGIFYKDENGAIKARLDQFGLPDKVLIRPNGTQIYITPDLALGRHKFEDYKLDLSIYVVGIDHELYFKQLFAIHALLGVAKYEQFFHLGFGMVNLTTGKMSTREGTVVVLDNLIQKLGKILQQKNPDKTLSEKIAICAINYYLLKVNSRQEIAFDPEKSISIDGNTGPYLQYTLVRTKSVLEKILNPSAVIPAKAGIQNSSSKENKSLDSRFHGNDKGESSNGTMKQCNNEELSLIRTLYQFPEVVQAAATNYAPNLLCNFLYDLAQKFNLFYGKHRIIEGENVNKFRLFLTKKTGEILARGMEILNLPIVEKM